MSQQALELCFLDGLLMGLMPLHHSSSPRAIKVLDDPAQWRRNPGTSALIQAIQRALG
jgi:hypothetical protein